jgi:hypothetical protein
MAGQHLLGVNEVGIELRTGVADRKIRYLVADVFVETGQPWNADEGMTWEVSIAWSDVGGRAEPVGYLVESPAGAPLPPDLLRRLPMGGIVRHARREAARMLKELQSRGLGLFDAEGLDHAARLEQAFSGRPGQLQEVAEIYRQAHLVGDQPVTAVAHRQGVSKSTAAKRVMAARRAGYLGQALPGRGGEVKE